MLIEYVQASKLVMAAILKKTLYLSSALILQPQYCVAYQHFLQWIENFYYVILVYYCTTQMETMHPQQQ